MGRAFLRIEDRHFLATDSAIRVWAKEMWCLYSSNVSYGRREFPEQLVRV